MNWSALPIGSVVTVILLPHHRPLPHGFAEHPHPEGSHHAHYGRIAYCIEDDDVVRPGVIDLTDREAAVFAILEEAALAGERCPTTDQLRQRLKPASHYIWATVTIALARKGVIIIRVYGRNFRVVEMLRGRAAGRATMPAPPGWEPYLVIGTETVRRCEPAERRQGVHKSELRAAPLRKALPLVRRVLPVARSDFIQAPTRAQLMGSK